MNTSNKKWAVGTALVLILLAMAGRPDPAEARSRLYVGADPGGVVMVIDSYPRYAHYRPEPRYAYYERSYRPVYVDRRYDYPPPPYWGDRRPYHHHHHHHHRYWDRGRW